MIARKWLYSLAAGALVAVFAQGCTSENAATSGRVCTPGAYVFCRCADRSEGTKLCKDDAQSFEACTTGQNGECAGGEISDPDTGTPITDDSNLKTELPPATGNEADACPGRPVALTPGFETSLSDDTSTGKSDYKGKQPGACAVGEGGSDHVYRVTPKGSGSLSIKVQGEKPLDATVYVRTSCADEATQVACAETTPAGGLEQLQYNVQAGKDYFVFVDGASGSAGKYKLTMKLTTGSFCGDGKIDTNEACDDGNKIASDGCSNDCKKIEGDSLAGNGCATGHAVDVWPGQKVNGNGSTNGFGNVWTKTGSLCTVSANDQNAAGEHIYAVTAHKAGTLKVVVTPEPTFNVQLVARTNCTDPASQLSGMCANEQSTGGVETMQFPVTNGQLVFVGVDGVLNSKGTYSLSFEIL